MVIYLQRILFCNVLSISRPKQPLVWSSPCRRLHMNSLRCSCYLPTIDQVSTDHRPSVGQLLTDTSVKYRRTIGEVSVKYRWTKSRISRDTSGTTIDRVSTECRPTIVRVWTDYRPTIDRYINRVSTAISTVISTDRSVETTYSKHDPKSLEILIFWMLRNNADVRRCSYFELGLPLL